MNTLTLKPHYIHLEELFKPYLTQLPHNTQNQELLHLGNQSSILAIYPIHFQIYVFIVTYSLIPQVCNQLIAKNIDQGCFIILQRLQQLPKNTYVENHQITNQPSHNITTITITQAYTHINEKTAKGEIITINNLQKNLPHLPHKITHILFNCTQQVRGYYPKTNLENINHTQPKNIRRTNHHATTLKIITWNTRCISSSLPGIQELTRTLHKDPHIILIRETKIHKLKSTTYIDRRFQNYKIIHNKSNNTTHPHNKYSGSTQARGGILAMIPKNIYTNENITNIPTPSSISPYLQTKIINNKPLTPIIIMNMYMPTHPQDLHLVRESNS